MSSDDIIISGGGSTTVATDGMLASARALAALAVAAADWDHGLHSIAVPSGASRWLFSAQRAVGDVRESSARLRDSLTSAAEAYGWAERSSEAALEGIGAFVGWELGMAAPLIGWMLLAALPHAVIALGVSSLFTRSAQNSVAGIAGWGASHSGMLRNPLVVTLVRQAVSSVDDGMLGFAHLPYPLARLLDDRATGAFGLRGAARVVVSLAGPTALKETPIAVSKVASTTASPPVGFGDLAARIPPSTPGAAQVRVERYAVPGEQVHWVVYVAGTIDTGFVPGSEPWDDTANIQGVAQLDPGSVRATHEALQAAGAQPGDSVLPVGYSQGGIAATELAAGDTYSTPELVTFGSPTGQMAVPSGVTDVALEHRDDIIPALGGEPRSPDQGGLDRILVQRTTYDTPPPIDGSPLEAHHIAQYATTAGLMDESSDPRLIDARNTLERFTGGGSAQVTMWRADRVAPDATRRVE